MRYGDCARCEKGEHGIERRTRQEPVCCGEELKHDGDAA